MRNKFGTKKDWYPKPSKQKVGDAKLDGNRVGMTRRVLGGYAFSNVYGGKALLPLSSMATITANKLFDGRKNRKKK